MTMNTIIWMIMGKIMLTTTVNDDDSDDGNGDSVE